MLALATPVLAQRGGGFDSWFGNFPGYQQNPNQQYDRPAPPADYSRAPAAKKPETPPTSTVLVIGDSLADWLAFGLEEALADTPELGVVRKHRASSGLVRYDSRNEAQDWAQVARDLIAAEKPSHIVIMVGLHDRQAIRERVAPARGAAPNVPGTAPSNAPATAKPATEPPPSAGEAIEPPKPQTPAIAAPEPPIRTRPTTIVHEFRSEKWIEVYGRRIDDLITAAKSRGVPVYWVGLPSLRGAKATADAQFLNEQFRPRAEKAGITYVDVWDGFADEAGRFALQGPDFEGQTRRLRTSDGVHFTRAGARKLAHFVEREIRRSASRGPVPVALPQSEPQPPTAPAVRPGTPVARPLAGPVVPLTAATGASSEDLLGGANARAAADYVGATRVLVKGEPVAAPAGRSDDFAWPRREIASFGKDPAVATTTLPLPQMHAPPAATVVMAPTVETPATTRVVARRPAQPRQQQQQQQQWRPFGGGGWGGGGSLFGGWR